MDEPARKAKYKRDHSKDKPRNRSRERADKKIKKAISVESMSVLAEIASEYLLLVGGAKGFAEQMNNVYKDASPMAKAKIIERVSDMLKFLTPKGEQHNDTGGLTDSELGDEIRELTYAKQNPKDTPS